MSREAMKLALEALEKLVRFESDSWELGSCRVASQAIKTLREALAKPDFWEGYVPEPVKPEVCCGEYATCLRACTPRGKWLANEALDKKAENARELGLDYEPVWGGGPTNKDYEDAMRQRRLHQLTSPPAQRTWVGLVWGELPEDGQNHDFLRGAVWAETKLKEKNQ